MIAIPVKTDRENPAVTTLFGKSKWFAFVDGQGNIEIKENETPSGRAVVENLVASGTTEVVFNNMGGNPFMLLQKAGIKCYHSGEERITLNEALEKLKENRLTEVTIQNMNNYVEKGKHTGSHSHDHNNEHHHEHHH